MHKIQVTRLHNLKGHSDSIYALQPSSIPNRFFSAAGDGMVVMWDQLDPGRGELAAKLPDSVYALHYQHREDVLIVGHNYNGIHVIDWKNKKQIGSLQITKAPIFDIQSTGKVVLVASGDGALTAVDLSRMIILKRIQTSEKNVRCIAINSLTGDVAVGSSDHFIRVYDEHLVMRKEWQAHTNSVFTVRYTPDRKFLMSGSRDARLKIWEVDANYRQAGEVVAHLYAINHLDFSPDGKHFVTCSMDKSIKVWDLAELKLLKVIDKARHAGHGTSVNKVMWTDFNNQVISAGDDRTLSVWQIIF